MSLIGKCAGCVALLLALSMVAEAEKRPARAGEAAAPAIHPPQKQTLFDFNFANQETNPSMAGSSLGFPALSSSSSESSEVDSDLDTPDVDEGVATGTVGNNANQVGGNLPFTFRNQGNDVGMGAAGDSDRLMARKAGSSGKGVGIAFGVLGLLTVVVAAAAFTLKRFRHNIGLPFVVRSSEDASVPFETLDTTTSRF